MTAQLKLIALDADDLAVISAHVQEARLQNPDLTDHDNTRIDYTPMSFDSQPATPFRWTTMPWFVETSDNHGNGQLLIFSDGHVQELGDLLAGMKPKASPSP